MTVAFAPPPAIANPPREAATLAVAAALVTVTLFTAVTAISPLADFNFAVLNCPVLTCAVLMVAETIGFRVVVALETLRLTAAPAPMAVATLALFTSRSDLVVLIALTVTPENALLSLLPVPTI